MTKVKALCISEQKGTIKHPVSVIECIENWGLKNDAHAGKWHRQVSLMSLADMAYYKQNYPNLEYGAYAENILIDDTRIATLPLQTRIKINNVILEITQIGKECHEGCAIKQKTGKCIMPQIGVFTRVIQGGTLHVNDEVTFEIIEKYDRQKNLFSPTKQAKFKTQKVALVGLGALGQMVAEQLVRIGFQDFILIDEDCIDFSNFNRQIYATHNTIHEAKVSITKKKLWEIEPNCHIEIHATHLDESNFQQLIPSNCILVDCCDDIPTKFLCESIASKKNIPLVHGAIDGWFGQVATIFPHQPILNQIYKNTSNKNQDSIIVSVTLIASFQVKEIIQITLGLNPSLKNKILFIDALNNEFKQVEIQS